MTRRGLILIATGVVALGGYLAAISMTDDPEPNLIYSLTETVPGVGSGGLIGKGTENFPEATFTITLPPGP